MQIYISLEATLISIFLYIITEKGMILGILSKFDLKWWSKPLYSCPICSSFWYTILLMYLHNSYDWHLPLISVILNKFYAEFDSKYFQK